MTKSSTKSSTERVTNPAERARIHREWAMPNSCTFDIPPIAALVKSYLHKSKVSVDPFARNKNWATYTNDLNPNTTAQCHLDAEQFCLKLRNEGVRCDLALFDPPYSPRQISECYQQIGMKASNRDTQNAALYARVRRALSLILTPDAVVISCGWNSTGMGRAFGMSIVEILLVCHGGGHNDTIVTVQQAHQSSQRELL